MQQNKLSVDSIKSKVFQNIFDVVNSAIVVLSSNDGKTFFIQDANSSFLMIGKRKKKEIINKDFQDIFPQIEQTGLLEVLQRVYKSGIKENFSIHFRATCRL